MNLRNWDKAKRIERERESVHFSLEHEADAPEIDAAEIERETGLELSASSPDFQAF